MLNWNAKLVTVDGGVQHERVTIVVRNNVATVRGRQGGAVVAQRDQVTGVMPVTGEALKRTVTFADGSSWLVEKVKGCGCGGR